LNKYQGATMSETAEVTAPTPTAPPRLPRDSRYFEIKSEIEEFLYDEANMLDERRFHEWLTTLADDLQYFMPMEFNVKFGEHAKKEFTTREKHMSWFNEGKWTLTKRAEQIQTGMHLAEEPLSRVCRLVTNIQLSAIGTNAADEVEVDVSSRFLIYQNRREYEQYFFVGDRMDRMLKTADGWKLSKREIRLHQNVLLAKNLTVFF